MGSSAGDEDDEGGDSEEETSPALKSLPFEYLLFRAARWLGVSPWVLAKQSLWWMFAALDFERAEARAEEIARKIAEERAKKDGDGEDGEDDVTE